MMRVNYSVTYQKLYIDPRLFSFELCSALINQGAIDLLVEYAIFMSQKKHRKKLKGKYGGLSVLQPSLSLVVVKGICYKLICLVVTIRRAKGYLRIV